MNLKQQAADAKRIALTKVMRDIVRANHAPIQVADEQLKAIRVWCAENGLPVSDADWFFKKMQRDKWRVCGVPVLDWKDTTTIFKNNDFFPSQRL